MGHKRNSRLLRLLILLVFLFPVLACIDPALFTQIENQLATLEAIEETIEKYLLPIQNFSIQPGINPGEVNLSWEHPMGDQLNYEIFFYDLPITEANWHTINVKQLNTRDITFTERNTTYQMKYTWEIFPTRQKYWVVIRQSLKGVQQAQTFFEMVGPLLGIELPEDTWETPPSVLAPSNMISFVDTGFRPDPDGYVFQNFVPNDGQLRPRVSRQDYIDMLRWVYGDYDVCIDLISGRCFPRWSANRVANDFASGGQCSGFTTTSGMFFLNLANLRNYIGSSVFPSYTINIRPDLNIYKFIMAYQHLQVQPEIFSGYVKSSSEDLHIQLKGLEDIMLDSWGLPNLAVWPNVRNCPGHSILPYMLIQENGRWANVWVYDNNHVRNFSKVVIYDLIENTWIYEVSDDVFWESTIPANSTGFCGSIGHFNISDFLSVEDGAYIGRAPWVQTRKSVIANVADRILVTASDGSQIGSDENGIIINEVPEALINVIDLEGTMIMLLPEDDYVFYVHSSTSESSGFVVMGGQETYAFDSIFSGDTISIVPGSIEYENNQQHTNPSISIILEEANRSSAFSVQPDISAGQLLSIQYDSETLDFNLSSTESMIYALDLDVLSIEGVFRFRNDQVEQAADDAYTISLEDITLDEENINIGIDTDDDGVIDQIIEIENEYDGDPDEIEESSPSGRRSLIIFIIIGLIIAIGIILGLVLLIQRNRSQQRRGSSRYSDRARQKNARNRDRNRTSGNRRAKSRPHRRNQNQNKDKNRFKQRYR